MQRRWLTGIALACLVTAGRPATAAPVSDRRPPAAADTAGIVDPFFRWCLQLVADDSLGHWSGREVRRRLRRLPGRTRLPLRHLAGITREAVPPAEAPAPAVRRRWRLEMRDDLRVPMPYSLFGYHPGRLDVSRELVLSEWDLDGAVLRWRDRDGRTGEADADLVRGLRVESGHVILDVDGWLDRLLGGKLDDTWTEALALVHVVRGEPPETAGWTAVALGRTPSGKPMLGGFDFYRDRALDRGRPIHHALSRLVRPWIAPYELGPGSSAWRWPKLAVRPGQSEP